MRTLIQVTQKDIDSNAHEPQYCPVARAIRRATKRRHVSVTHKKYSINYGDLKSFPLKTQTFIKRYDSGLSVQPFSFYITLDA